MLANGFWSPGLCWSSATGRASCDCLPKDQTCSFQRLIGGAASEHAVQAVIMLPQSQLPPHVDSASPHDAARCSWSADLHRIEGLQLSLCRGSLQDSVDKGTFFLPRAAGEGPPQPNMKAIT